MSEKCKTCAYFKPYKTGDHLHGNCEVLPGHVGVSWFAYFPLTGEFGCAGHREMPDLGEVTRVHVTRIRKDGSTMIDEYGKLPPGIWDKVHRFLAGERIEKPEPSGDRAGFNTSKEGG